MDCNWPRYCEELRILRAKGFDLKKWRGIVKLGKIKIRSIALIKSFCISQSYQY